MYGGDGLHTAISESGFTADSGAWGGSTDMSESASVTRSVRGLRREMGQLQFLLRGFSASGYLGLESALVGHVRASGGRIADIHGSR
jgi:hypothetical protein